MTALDRLKSWWSRYRSWRHVRPDSDSAIARMYRESLLHTFGWTYYRQEQISAITLRMIAHMTATGMPLWCALRWARWIVRENQRRMENEAAHRARYGAIR